MKKKKLKTFRDYPIFVAQLTNKSASTTAAVGNTNTSSTPQKPTSDIPPSTPPPSVSQAPPKVYANQTTARRRKSMIRIKPQESEEKEKVAKYYGDEPFTLDHLKAKWNIYTDRVKEISGGFSASVLSGCEPQILEDQKTIHLVFRNETNELEFTRLSLDLIEFLKEELKNNHINFQTEVNKQKAKKVLYTNKDKFDHFTEKYPQLNDWADKLKLELK